MIDASLPLCLSACPLAAWLSFAGPVPPATDRRQRGSSSSPRRVSRLADESCCSFVDTQQSHAIQIIAYHSRASSWLRLPLRAMCGRVAWPVEYTLISPLFQGSSIALLLGWAGGCVGGATFANKHHPWPRTAAVITLSVPVPVTYFQSCYSFS